MKRTAIALLAAAATAALPATASASGPAPHGKEVIALECEGLGKTEVAVVRNEHGKGAGQIVGSKGHGIPVSFTFAVTDLTTGEVIFEETETTGRGRSHRNQPTTTCRSSEPPAPASEVFGEELPPGVGPTDLIRFAFEAHVIIKR